MNKTVILSLSIIAVTSLICFFIYTQNNRFVTANAGDGKVYRIDKRTGESVLIYGTSEIPVKPSEPQKEETIEDTAIRLAKTAHTLEPESIYLGIYLDNDSYIRNWIQKQTGSLKIIGWEVRQVEDQISVVTYSFEKGNGIRSYAFEVDLHAGLVRNIIGDPELEKRYGFK